ncbi:MAG: cytochrome c family protein [Xanthobacteraceae bacterium]|nr:cytochrome c family protein [Xanthobacteraceae bacterium]
MKLTASIFALSFIGITSAHAQDVDAGRRVFNKCIACHSVGPGAKNKIGPELNGLIGRRAGSVPGFSYSDANKQSGITWTEDEFAKYIRDPQGTVKGTKMAFAGLKNDQEIKDVTAFLKSFDKDGNQK